METIVEHAQILVYSLLALMPSVPQKASFSAMMGLFLGADGHAVPQHTSMKSPSALSRFLNHYSWSTRAVVRTMRQAVMKQLTHYSPRRDQPLQVMIDLTSLEKTGQFLHLGASPSDAWVRWLNKKRGLHVVVLYLVIGEWRMPWSFRIWQGKGQQTPSHLAVKLLGNVPRFLHQGHPVLVLADTEFGTIEMFQAIRARGWRSAIGLRESRLLENGCSLKRWYRQGKRGQQLRLKDLPFPLTVSWFWLKRQGKPPFLGL
jgi:DDE superfamily endonuclease